MSRNVLEMSQNHMATTFTFELALDSNQEEAGEQALQIALEKISTLEQKLSEFIVSSDVGLLNQSKAGRTIELSEDFCALYYLSEKLAFETEGAFQPTQGPGQFFFNPELRTISKSKDTLKIGFGAIGKGWALDQAKALLIQSGFSDFRLNAGGSSLVLSGQENEGVPWEFSWGIQRNAHDQSVWGKRLQWIRRLGELARRSTELCIGVSGLMEQGPHIRGVHPESRAMSSLVFAPSAAVADALSTALFVNPKLISRFSDYGLAVMHSDGSLISNDTFRNTFAF